MSKFTYPNLTICNCGLRSLKGTLRLHANGQSHTRVKGEQCSAVKNRPFCIFAKDTHIRDMEKYLFGATRHLDNLSGMSGNVSEL